jgi:hypothetical protein
MKGITQLFSVSMKTVLKYNITVWAKSKEDAKKRAEGNAINHYDACKLDMFEPTALNAKPIPRMKEAGGVYTYIEAYSEYAVVEKGGVRVVLSYIGEGRNGHYDETDPDDERLLTFTIYEGDEPVPEGSRRTLLPANLSAGKLVSAAEYIMVEVFAPIAYGHSIERICDLLSKMDESWLE